MRYDQFRSAALVLIVWGAILLFTIQANAQRTDPNVRIARLKIDPAKLEAYKAALREEIEAAIRIEPGVLSLYAVHDQNDPGTVTVFEIYASEEAYRSHVQTPHFKKYKETTAAMVKSLDLAVVTPIALASKMKPTAQTSNQ